MLRVRSLFALPVLCNQTIVQRPMERFTSNVESRNGVPSCSATCDVRDACDDDDEMREAEFKWSIESEKVDLDLSLDVVTRGRRSKITTKHETTKRPSCMMEDV